MHFALLTLPGCAPSSDTTPPPQLPKRGPAPIRVSSDPWVVSTDGWGTEHRSAYLGNGYIGQRIGQTGTALSPSGAEPAFLAGCYQHEQLVTLPPLLPLQVRSGGQAFGADPSRLKSYHQELRLRDGTLLTRAVWDAGAGEVALEIEAALLRQQPDLALLRARVENGSQSAVDVGTSADSGGAPAGVSLSHALQPLNPTALQPAIGKDVSYTVPAGQSATFALVTQVRADRSSGAPSVRPLSSRPQITPEQVDRWLDGHRQAWERLWASDIEIEGDAEAQEVVRACLYQLLSSVRAEDDRGVPPMGLSSAAFNGHVFWDMDSWMLPALLPQHPDLARAMLEYRYRTLDGARANARAEGLPGASYAWESASTGRETITGGFQYGRHVTGDVALALQQYYRATGDSAWLRSRAWPILKDTADNWAARARPGAKGEWTIPGVFTPDELAGRVSQSAWTNYVARENLRFAGETARALGVRPAPRWDTVAKGLNFLRGSDGLILAYAGFGEKSRSKQADALLLAHPGQLDLAQSELGKMYDFYAPRVIANGPAMTDAIHAVVAARLGRSDEALKRFQECYRPFVRPPFHQFSEKRTRDNLCFLTGAAGVVEAVLYGFAGLHLEPDKAAGGRPRLEPHLPASWTALRVHGLQWRGKKWDVELIPGAAPVWKAAS